MQTFVSLLQLVGFGYTISKSVSICFGDNRSDNCNKMADSSLNIWGDSR
jgi:hypothetical protein